MDHLNQLNARLLKAQMKNDETLIQQYRQEIEEYKQKQRSDPQSSSQSESVTNCRPVVDNELNTLSVHLLRAEMQNNTDKIAYYKKEIEEYKKRKQNISPENRDLLNRLTSQLLKAELNNDTEKCKQLKIEIDELKKQCNSTDGDQSIKTTNEQSKDEPVNKVEEVKIEEQKTITKTVIDIEKVFDELVRARMKNDKKIMDACDEEIEKFEYVYNFKNEDDLKKIIFVTDECLNNVIKDKESAECNGDKELMKHLDRKAKAIRRKNLDYRELLEKLIKSKPVEKPKPVSRIHPSHQFKQERIDTDDWKESVVEETPKTRTVHVIKKPDENNMTLKQMFVNERRTDANSEDARFVNTSSRIRRVDDEYEGTTDAKRKRTNNDRYVTQKDETDDKCDYCVENVKGHLIVENDDKLIVIVPEKEPLIDHQLVIRSVEHCVSSVSASEDVIEKLNQLKQKICHLFESLNKRVVFIEHHLKNQSKWNRHFEITAYPIDEGDIEFCMMSFKKEISDSGQEWSMNRKLILLTKEKPVHRSIPKNLSYFCVTFDSNNTGFAHMIEDAHKFPRHFGQSIIGGLLNLDSQRWLKPRYQDFKNQQDRVESLRKLWSRFSGVSSR